MLRILKKAPPEPEKREQIAVGTIEAAEMLGISRRTLWTLTRENRVPHTRVGRRILYSVEGLRRFAAGDLDRPESDE